MQPQRIDYTTTHPRRATSEQGDPRERENAALRARLSAVEEENAQLWAELAAAGAAAQATLGQDARARALEGENSRLRAELAGRDRQIAGQAFTIRRRDQQVAQLERQVRLLQEEPARADAAVRAQAAQAEEASQRNRDLLAQRDKRLPGSHVKIRMALVVEGCSREEPTPITLDAIAASAGLCKETVCQALQDMEVTGQILRDPRPVLRERPCKDKKGRLVPDENGEPKTYMREETQLWVQLSDGPDPGLTKEQVRALCPNLMADRKRHCCPSCGSTRLVAKTLTCRDCGTVCTAKEAEQAGKAPQL